MQSHTVKHGQFCSLKVHFVVYKQLNFPTPLSRDGRRAAAPLSKMAAPLTLLFLLAVTVRAALFNSSLKELISDRVEVVSPLTAWKRGWFRCFGSHVNITDAKRRCLGD